MNLRYRITWVAYDAWVEGNLAPNAPWGPTFVPIVRQGGSRFDNPRYYAALYLARQKEAAYAEVFGTDVPSVAADDLVHPSGAIRCLVTYEIDEPRRICDLDDAATLLEHDLRPSDVVRRDREVTQDVAYRLWVERETNRYIGLAWWSYFHPAWTVGMLWSDRLVGTEVDRRPEFDHVTVTSVEPVVLRGNGALEAAARRCRFRIEA